MIGTFPVLHDIFTLWLFNMAMESDPFIDGLPLKNGGSFHGYVSHSQMVAGKHPDGDFQLATFPSRVRA